MTIKEELQKKKGKYCLVKDNVCPIWITFAPARCDSDSSVNDYAFKTKFGLVGKITNVGTDCVEITYIKDYGFSRAVLPFSVISIHEGT